MTKRSRIFRNRPASACSSCMRLEGLPDCVICGWRTCPHWGEGGVCHWCKRTGGVDPMLRRYREAGMAGNPGGRRRLERRAARGDASAKARLEAEAAARIDAELAKHGISEDDVSCFVAGFFDWALWNCMGNDDELLSDRYRDSDFSDDCWDRVTKEAKQFVASAAPFLLRALGHERMERCCDNRCERWHELGGDFFATRRGSREHFAYHYGQEIGGPLNVAANPFPEVVAREGDGGVYLDEA